MKPGLVRSAAFMLLLLASACTRPETTCTLIGSASGLSVTVDRAVAPNLETLKVRVCWDTPAGAPVCRRATVELSAGSDTVDQGCDGLAPDAACSATVVPNGSKVGFVELHDLPEARVTVTATATISGRARTLPPIEKAASPSYPNGPHCDPGGVQAVVALDSRGLR